MRLCSVAIFIMLVTVANALDMNEQIYVYEGGKLDSRSNSGYGEDQINARGEQEYTRYLISGEDSSGLESNYKCSPLSTSGSGNDSPKYYYHVSGKSLSGTEHSVEVEFNRSIEASSTINANGGSFSTNFEIKSDFGNLTERLSVPSGIYEEGLDVTQQADFLVDTMISGNFSLSSAVTDETYYWSGYDVDELRLKLADVNTIGTPEKDAELFLETGYEKSPQEEAAQLIKEGLRHHLNDSFDKAIGFYDKALELDSSSKVAALAWMYKGNAFISQNRYLEAIDSYDKALQRNPENKEVMRDKAIALATTNETRAALDLLNETVEKFPGFASAWYNRGRLLEDFGMYKLAAESFETTLAIDPQYENAEEKLAEVEDILNEIENIQNNGGGENGIG